MKLATLRRSRVDGLSGVTGVARLDRRTKRLAGRLNPGDIAIIDHVDLDRVAAESLVEAKVSAVVNAQPSISGRYPNLGPDLLVSNGIALLDNVGDEAFAANTMEYMKRERALLLDGVGVPEVRTSFERRHVLVVVRGNDYKADLDALKNYIREYRPVLVGVDGGADALYEAGHKPHVIVGDMDSVSDDVLTCGAEVVVHAYPDGRAPGLARVQDLGIDAVTFPALGTSEDIAMLLANERGASLIVAVGTHATLDEFLDKGRIGMASTFLTRLRVGGKLVDAKGVSRLYRSRISSGALLLLVLAAFIAIGAALAVSDAGRTYLDLLGDRWDRLVDWIQGLLS